MEATGSPVIPGYRYMRLISSSGGFGDVHLYEDLQLGRSVAVKVLRELDHSGPVTGRFMAEANAMAALQHPNIVQIYAAGRTDDGRPYLVMPYCPGPTMETRAAGGRLGVPEVLKVAVQVGSAVETAHRAGLLHRDIKPANILTQPGDVPGLTDFGVAARMSVGESNDDEVGLSPPWSAPEMFYTSTQGTPAADVYSLTATVWHLLVGRSPFEVPGGDNRRMALMGRIRTLPAPATGRPDVPESLERVLRRGLRKKPEERFQTMADLVSALQSVEQELRLPPTPAILIGSDDTAWQWTPAAIDGRTSGGPGDDASHAVSTSGAVPVAQGLPASDRPTQLRGRRAGPGAAEDPTQRRPVVTDVSLTTATDQAPSGRSRTLLLAGGSALVVLAAIGGYLLVGQGRDHAHLTGDAATSSTAGGASGGVLGDQPDDVLPPGPVAVSGKARGSHVIFTWDYSAALSSDTYRWRVEGGPKGVSSKPTTTVSKARGRPTCLQVIVVRADGSDPSRTWSEPGCVTE